MGMYNYDINKTTIIYTHKQHTQNTRDTHKNSTTERDNIQNLTKKLTAERTK
jgi:hypothetical protein